MTDKNQAEDTQTQVLEMVTQLHAAAALLVSSDPRTHREQAEALGVSAQDLTLLVSASHHRRLALKKAFNLAVAMGLDPVVKVDGRRLVAEEGADLNETLRLALGELLASTMKAQGVKGGELARMAGVNPARVSLALSSERHMKVSPDRVLQLLALLDVQPVLGVDVRLPADLLIARLTAQSEADLVTT